MISILNTYTVNRIVSAILFLIVMAPGLDAQNIFPQKVEGCDISQFCLDCGEPKAIYDADGFKAILESINSSYSFKGGKGKIGFQILVDSVGHGCVLSHTDASANPLSKDIITLLNGCKWLPARENNKAVSSSINVVFEITKDKLSGQVERIDLDDMNENMKNPGTPEIYNKSYKYSNQTLGKYEITVWQKGNSRLPHDMSTTSVVDKKDNVWYATYNGFVKFDGNQITRLNESNSPFKKNESVRAITVDNQNNKWINVDKEFYKYDNNKWEKPDSGKINLSWAYNIVASENGEVLFCTNEGLVILNNDRWSKINMANTSQLPSNSILYAYRDKKERLWIGTYKGTIMIDTNGDVTEFNKTTTPINKICISGATGDAEGNIYFSLYAYEKSTERNKSKEGFAILTKDGKWIHYNDTNSGLPANHVNSILFDKFENVLWIGTNEAGLVRFDLKDGWENYHNLNSQVPSSYIFDLSQDSKGNIYASTFYGMMKIKKK